MQHMDFIIVIFGVLCSGGYSIDFPKVTTFTNLPFCCCWYGNIKREKQVALNES